MNEDEVNGSTTECNGKCPPLELTLINGSLSQSRQCCHLPKGCSSAQSTLQRCSSLQLGPADPHTGSLPLSSTPYDNHTSHKLLLEGFPEEGPARVVGHPAMIAPPPRTTSLIASLLDKGGAPKLTRSYTASPASTLSWTERAGSGRSLRADKMLPLDSTFCHRVQRQTSDGQSSSTSTLAPSETAWQGLPDLWHSLGRHDLKRRFWGVTDLPGMLRSRYIGIRTTGNWDYDKTKRSPDWWIFRHWLHR